MPKAVTAMLGLVLVAISIGFNTARYPIIWEMVGAAGVNSSPGPTKSPVSEEVERPTSSPPPVVSVPSPSDAVVTPAAPRIGDRAADAAPASLKPVNTDGTAAAESEPSQSLTPVLAADVLAGGNGLIGSGVRRLPPVQNDAATAAAQTAGQLTYGVIPVYPTTGID